jgi:hypothetical protein
MCIYILVFDIDNVDELALLGDRYYMGHGGMLKNLILFFCFYLFTLILINNKIMIHKIMINNNNIYNK